MKKIFVLFAIVLVLFLQLSCNRIFMYAFGTRNPKIECKESITKFLDDIHVRTDNCYSLKDTSTFNKYLKHLSAPDVEFYDKFGNLMLYADSAKCNGQNSALIDSLNPNLTVNIDKTKNLFLILDDFRTLDGSAVDKSEFVNYDFYVVIFFAKWLGAAINEGKIPDWENSLKSLNDTTVKIKAIKVAYEYMDYMHVNKNEMFKIYSRDVESTTK